MLILPFFYGIVLGWMVRKRLGRVACFGFKGEDLVMKDAARCCL